MALTLSDSPRNPLSQYRYPTFSNHCFLAVESKKRYEDRRRVGVERFKEAKAFISACLLGTVLPKILVPSSFTSLDKILFFLTIKQACLEFILDLKDNCLAVLIRVSIGIALLNSLLRVVYVFKEEDFLIIISSLYSRQTLSL
jgi:hypothetical protein